MEKGPFEIYGNVHLQSPTLIVGWQTSDAGKIGSRVIDFLRKKLGGREIAEIKPSDFFLLSVARFQDSVLQVPESKFWACAENNLLLFKSYEPEFEWYSFLNAVLDLAGYYCGAKELYTVNGNVSFIAHTTSCKIITVVNQPELKKGLLGKELEAMEYQGPPAISTYLLWVAQQRKFSGTSLWPQVPFYLAATRDPLALKLVLSFFNRRFNLRLDFEELDLEIRKRNEKLADLREGNPEIDEYIRKLEAGLSLNEEEQMELAGEVYEILEEKS